MDTDNQSTQTETPVQDAPQNDAALAAHAQAGEDAPAELVQTDDVKKIIETLLFITDRPVKASRVADVVETVNAKQVAEIITELTQDYARRGSAVQIVEIAGGYQMSTKPEYGRWVRRLYNEKMTTKLSNAALETLAIVAYKQPLTRAEMESIRGVDVAGPLERLLERGLVRVVGKKDTVGRPMVYGTTDEFLRMFGLNKISELPDLQVFAAKNLHEKQADLPFGEPLPPVGEPGIIALEDLDEAEKLEALGTPVDSFFTRTTYNRGELFVKDLAEGESAGQQLARETAPQDESGADITPQNSTLQTPETDASAEAEAQEPETKGLSSENSLPETTETIVEQTAVSDRDNQPEVSAGKQPTDELSGSKEVRTETTEAVGSEEAGSASGEGTFAPEAKSDPAREEFLKQFGAPSELPVWEEPSSDFARAAAGALASEELKNLETGLDAVLSQEADEHLANQAAALQAELEEKAEEAGAPSAERQESTEEK